LHNINGEQDKNRAARLGAYIERRMTLWRRSS